MQAVSSYLSLLGHFGSTISSDYGGRVGTIKDPDLIRSNFQIQQDSLDAAKEFGITRSLELNQQFEGANKPLNPATISNMSFGYPSSTAYKSEQVTLSQPRWQRLASSSTTPWVEPPVLYKKSAPTMAWPGRSTWLREDSFRSIAAEAAGTLYDQNLARPKDPNQNKDLYTQAVLPTITPISLAAGLRTVS